MPVRPLELEGPFGSRWSCWATARLALGTWTAGTDWSLPRRVP